MRAYLKNYETFDVQESFDPLADVKQGEGGSHSKSENRALHPMNLLAERAGMKPDTLYYTLRGRIRTISFWDLDRLLAAMDCVHLWRSEPLLSYYEAEEVA